jgi:hypothetical protein
LRYGQKTQTQHNLAKFCFALKSCYYKNVKMSKGFKCFAWSINLKRNSQK